MILKPREIPKKLLVLQYLEPRIELSQKDKYILANDRKGLAGEQYVDTLLEKLSFDHYSLKGLSLTWNGAKFQLDNAIISQHIVHNLEVKNLEGDYYIEDDKWYSLDSGKSRTNPLNQLDRADTLLRQMVSYYKMNLQIKSLLLFPNPQFTLFQASKDLPIVLPTQLNKFIEKLNTISSTLNPQHRWLADKMIALHQEEDPFQYISTQYEFDQLRKGVVCAKCRVILPSYMGIKLYVPHVTMWKKLIRR